MISVAWASGHTAAATSLVTQVNNLIVFPLISLLLAVAVLVFVWGGFQYLFNADDPAARKQGRQHILFGLIGIVVMVAAYAILSIALRTFFGGNVTIP